MKNVNIDGIEYLVEETAAAEPLCSFRRICPAETVSRSIGCDGPAYTVRDYAPLLFALSRLREEGEDLHLVFHVDGYFERKIKEHADYYGVEEAVHFISSLEEIEGELLETVLLPGRTPGGLFLRRRQCFCRNSGKAIYELLKEMMAGDENGH